MHIGASTVLLEKAGPPDLLEAIVAHRATVCFTAPTSYRAMAAGAREKKLGVRDGGPLRKCVAAGEALPAATRALWKEATGIEIIDGIGATEMFHIFISADEAHARPGATGTRGARLPRARRRRRRQRRSRRHDRPPRGAGPHRLPLPRRRRARPTTSRTAGTTPATPTCRTPTATSSTRRAPTT